MDPKEWFELGRKKGTALERELYFIKGLKLGNAFLPWAWVGIGDAKLAQGDKDAALSMYKKAIEIDTTFSPAWDRVKKHGPQPPPPKWAKRGILKVIYDLKSKQD